MCRKWWCCFCGAEDKVDSPLQNVEEIPLQVKETLEQDDAQEVTVEEYSAQFNFEASVESDLSFKRGDILLVEENHTYNSCWAKATNKETNKTGYVPITFLAKTNTLDSEPWYAATLSYFAAESLLLSENYQDGTFIVTPGDYTKYMLAVKCTDESSQAVVKHYEIHADANDCLFISKMLKFPNLHNLITAYLRDKENKLGLATHLTKACHKSEPVIYELSGGYRKNWEINEDEVHVNENAKLGSGNSSTIYKGVWLKKEIAVKTLKHDHFADRLFKRELEIMKHLRHPNIVSLYGYCSNCNYILLEYIPNGDLKTFIQNQELKEKDKYYIMSQIIDAMKYLETKQIVHRDLAARNILVGKRLTVKLADFGLSVYLAGKSEYVLTTDLQLAIKWLAPECVDGQKIYSSKSDVWAFGILVMEIYTKGDIPYAELENSNNAMIIQDVRSGYRMKMPSEMPIDIYKVLLKCWDHNSKSRPSFSDLSEFVKKKSKTVEVVS